MEVKELMKEPFASVKKVDVCVKVDSEIDSDNIVYDLLEESLPIDETSDLETRNKFPANQSVISETNSTLFGINTKCLKVNKTVQNKSSKVKCMISNCNFYVSILEEHKRIESLLCQECRNKVVGLDLHPTLLQE